MWGGQKKRQLKVDKVDASQLDTDAEDEKKRMLYSTTPAPLITKLCLARGSKPKDLPPVVNGKPLNLNFLGDI